MPAGDFATEIAVPANSHGPCHLRLAIGNDTSQALGATNIYVRQTPEDIARLQGSSAVR